MDLRRLELAAALKLQKTWVVQIFDSARDKSGEAHEKSKERLSLTDLRQHAQLARAID